MIPELTAEQQSRLKDIPEHEGTTVEELLIASVLRQLRDQAPYLQAVNEGIAEPDRGVDSV
jgi:hypothetical protein